MQQLLLPDYNFVVPCSAFAAADGSPIQPDEDSSSGGGDDGRQQRRKLPMVMRRGGGSTAKGEDLPRNIDLLW